MEVAPVIRIAAPASRAFLRRAVRYLADDAGIDFDTEPADMPWLWREARLRDPDGHHLCLFRAGDNRRYPPWRLQGR